MNALQRLEEDAAYDYANRIAKESDGRFCLDARLRCLCDLIPIDDDVEVWLFIAEKVYDQYFWILSACVLVDARPEPQERSRP